MTKGNDVGTAQIALAAAASFAAGAGVAWALLRTRAGATTPPPPFERARVVLPPHPAWVPPEPQPSPFRGGGGSSGDEDAATPMIEIDPSTTPKAEVYALCISAVVPRPIALVSSVGPGAVPAGGGGGGGGGEGAADGSPAPPSSSATTVNVAPYSYFNILSHDPPTVAIGMCRSSARGGARKDSFANIEATG